MFEEEKEELYLESPLEVIHCFDTIGKTIEFFGYVFEECATLIKANASDKSFIPPIQYFKSAKTYNIDERFMSTMVVSYLQNNYQIDSSSLARLVDYFGSEKKKERTLVKRSLYVSVFGDHLDLTPLTFRSDTTAACYKKDGKNVVVLTLFNYYSVLTNGLGVVSFNSIPVKAEPLMRYTSNFKRGIDNYTTVSDATEDIKSVAFGYKNVEAYWDDKNNGTRTEVFTFNLD